MIGISKVPSQRLRPVLVAVSVFSSRGLCVLCLPGIDNTGLEVAKGKRLARSKDEIKVKKGESRIET